MKFYNYLNEKRKRSVIVVDVQPMYESYIKFSMERFTNFLVRNYDILYFYNGPETVGVDDKNDIVRFLMESSDYSDDLYYKLMSELTKWIDKGYAFFRGWMDQGVDEATLKQAIRIMFQRKIYDSRDIEEDEWIELLPELEGIHFDDMISIPDIQINELKKWSGSYLVGGGRNECLAEVKILMDAFNIRYQIVNEFIYG